MPQLGLIIVFVGTLGAPGEPGDQNGKRALRFCYFEPVGLSAHCVFAVFEPVMAQGMNRLCGILAISHLGGTVDDDDDVTHLDIPLPPPHHAQEKNTS